MKRVQPHQDAPLRPLLEADDDLWLDVCRQLHGVLAKRLKAQLPTPKAGILSHSFDFLLFFFVLGGADGCILYHIL